MSNWQVLNERFIALTLRERLLMMLAGAVILIMGLFVFVVEPAVERNAQVKQQLAGMQIQLQTLLTQERALKIQLGQDPNQALNERIQTLNVLVDDTNSRLSERLSQLVPADQMPELLQDLLKKNDGIRLLEMRSLTPEIVAAPNAQQDDATNLYRHGVSLALEGRYRDVQRYLRDLEALPWQFQWQSFDYQVADYPLAKVTLEIFTVSTNEAFIGV